MSGLLLLYYPADINTANKNVRSAPSFAAAPSVHGANGRKSPSMVIDNLILHGADVYTKDNTRRTALGRAQSEGCHEAADFLRTVKHGVGRRPFESEVHRCILKLTFALVMMF